ncbi:MAG: hypothetical protein A2Y38_22460 [Spirochaetes bacterium GWB1_59_5]|nr:MAG: hypothetical protein A2Y38_22460 [Spirochaetes bacterium GWB1_59_5]
MLGLSALAAITGRFVGAALKECGPDIVDILETAIRRAFRDSVEEGARRDDLRERLASRVRLAFDHRPERGASENPGDSAIRKGVDR